MLLPALLLFTVAATEPALGTPLKQDGYSVRPPSEFRTVRKELFHGTRVGAVAQDPKAERFLSAALMDGETEAAATMLVSWVEGSFSATPSSRDTFATAVVRHFSDELGMKLQLETVQAEDGPAPRIEVVGTVKQQDQVRKIVLAAFEGDTRHAVITFSVPTGRYDELKPEIEASLDTFAVDQTATSGISRSLAGALAGAALGALLVSVGLWRNRQKRVTKRGEPRDLPWG